MGFNSAFKGLNKDARSTKQKNCAGIMKTRALHVEVSAKLISVGSVLLEDRGNRSLEPAKSLNELGSLKYL